VAGEAGLGVARPGAARHGVAGKAVFELMKNYVATENGILSDAQAPIVGKEFERIEKVLGAVTPDTVVCEAKPAASPIHKFFTWNDGEAAKKCRLQEARRLIGSVATVEVTHNTSKPMIIRAFHSVESSKTEKSFSGTAYISTARAMKNKHYRAQILDYAKMELMSWSRRYKHLKEFAKVHDAVEDMALEAA